MISTRNIISCERYICFTFEKRNVCSMNKRSTRVVASFRKHNKHNTVLVKHVVQKLWAFFDKWMTDLGEAVTWPQRQLFNKFLFSAPSKAFSLSRESINHNLGGLGSYLASLHYVWCKLSSLNPHWIRSVLEYFELYAIGISRYQYKQSF